LGKLDCEDGWSRDWEPAQASTTSGPLVRQLSPGFPESEVGNPSARIPVDPLLVELGRAGRRIPAASRYRSAMVAMSEEFRRRWEAERVRREEAELVELARLLMMLIGDRLMC
jgi:hypothetical protein